MPLTRCDTRLEQYAGKAHRQREGTGMVGDARCIVGALYRLDEPWRGRFLVLVANLATGWRWAGREPERGELTGWLENSLSLQRYTVLLLRRWTGELRGRDRETG